MKLFFYQTYIYVQTSSHIEYKINKIPQNNFEVFQNSIKPNSQKKTIEIQTIISTKNTLIIPNIKN